MATMTVEQRILSEHGCSVSELLASFAAEGLSSKQVADKLDCGVSNVRRIARKYGIRFNQPTSQTKITHSDEFNDPQFNATNLLSRAWGKAMFGRTVHAVEENIAVSMA